MKKTFLLLMLLATAAMTFAQEKNIKVIEPSEYRDFNALLGPDRYEIDSLVVNYEENYLSDSDVLLIADCCKNGRLTGVDLSRCSNVASGRIPDNAFAPDVLNAKPRKAEAVDNVFTNLCYIKLPAGIKSIGDRAFAFTNLESISLSYRVRTLGDGAFDCCPNLKSVTLFGSDRKAEMMCNGFRMVPSGAVLNVAPGLGDYYRETELGDKFDVRESESALIVKALELDGSRTLAGQLGDNSMTVDSLTLSGTLTAADIEVMCTSIEYGRLMGIDLSDCIIEGGSFYGSRVKSLRLPRRMEKILPRLLSRTKAEHLTMPENYGEICNYAFVCASGFADSALIVPEGCRRIGYNAFAGSTSVKQLVLPSTLEVLESRSLGFCLRDMWRDEEWNVMVIRDDVKLYVNRMYPPESPSTSEDLQGGSLYVEGPFGCDVDAGHPYCATKGWTLYVPMGARKNYENAEHWSHFETIIETPLLTGTSTGISAAVTAQGATIADGVYTVDGRRVAGRASETALPKGLYIVRENGTARKVIMGR